MFPRTSGLIITPGHFLCGHQAWPLLPDQTHGHHVLSLATGVSVHIGADTALWAKFKSTVGSVSQAAVLSCPGAAPGPSGPLSQARAIRSVLGES